MGFPVTQAILERILGNAWTVGAEKTAAKTYAGDPTNNVTPDYQYQMCIDTSGAHLYWASTAASSGWKKLNN